MELTDWKKRDNKYVTHFGRNHVQGDEQNPRRANNRTG